MGHVRELENVNQEVIVLTHARLVETVDLRIRLPPSRKEAGADSMKRAEARVLAEFQKSYVTEMLRAHRGNVNQAAREAQRSKLLRAPRQEASPATIRRSGTCLRLHKPITLTH